ncbi:MAG: proline dehydrogenase, partial [Myxococcales bacterium]|nr:proline dehydrogenase [Myxococcales bacterium]
MSVPFDGAQRIDAALSVARRVRDPRDPLGIEARARLLPTSGLSREGLELALTEHLETDASPAERERLLAWARDGVGPSARCHVVLSANVVTAALRAIVLGLVSAPEVRVKPSRREPALAPLLVAEIAPLLSSGELALVDSLDVAPGDQVHAYGRDE